MSKSAAIIIGASGGLGSALCRQWQSSPEIDHVIAISRKNISSDYKDDVTVTSLQCDYREESIVNTCEAIKTVMKELNLDSINRVCICNGILHNEKIWPEKRIEDISIDAMLDVFTVNSVIPILWLKALIKLVRSDSNCIIAVFNARIGSIGDNRSGGWYSYRASKAALNMLLKTASIEFARRAKNVKLIAFHPGTTDTNLTKPFQSSVKPENLFKSQFVAEHLVHIMNHQTPDGELSFVDWENKNIVW